jgi:Cu-processing system permease protein
MSVSIASKATIDCQIGQEVYTVGVASRPGPRFMNVKTVSYIARHEFLINIRNKWTLAFAALFAILVLAISYFGMALVGYEVEFQDFYRTTASLLNLVMYVIPIVALVMGTNSFAGNGGSFDLLFSQPVSRGEVLIGKFSGLFVSVSVSTLLGFGLAGMVIALRSDYEGVWRYALFVLISLGLAMSFFSLSILAAILAKRKAKAFVIVLLLWFFFVIFYDLLVISLTYFIEESYLRPALFLSLIGNPVDIMRVLTLMTIGGTSALGPAGAGLIRYFGGAWSSLMLGITFSLLWIIVPLLIASWVLKRQDI